MGADHSPAVPAAAAMAPYIRGPARITVTLVVPDVLPIPVALLVPVAPITIVPRVLCPRAAGDAEQEAPRRHHH
jgi:hypothetical protein